MLLKTLKEIGNYLESGRYAEKNTRDMYEHIAASSSRTRLRFQITLKVRTNYPRWCAAINGKQVECKKVTTIKGTMVWYNYAFAHPPPHYYSVVIVKIVYDMGGIEGILFIALKYLDCSLVLEYCSVLRSLLNLIPQRYSKVLHDIQPRDLHA